MRGSLTCKISSSAARGIIPAHAGLTRRDTTKQGRCRGSSPRMRGSQAKGDPEREKVGIIPAHAGLTLKNPNIDAILSGPHPVFYSVLRVIR